MSSVVLDVPAETFNGLREQAKSLEIPGRGRMNKAELYAAVKERFDILRAREAGKRDLLAQMGLDDGEPVAPGTVRMEVNLDSLNASLARIGKDFTVTEADLNRAGMVPMPAKTGPAVSVPAGGLVTLSDVPWTVHAPRGEAVETPAVLVTTSHGRMLSTRDLKRLESCGLAPGESIVDVRPLALTGGTREEGRKGTGLHRTREGRKTYPAGKARGGRKGGRK